MKYKFYVSSRINLIEYDVTFDTKREILTPIHSVVTPLANSKFRFFTGRARWS